MAASETALSRPRVLATALRLGSLAAVEPSTGTGIGSKTTSRSTLLGLIHTQRSTAKLVSVELRDRRGSGAGIGELDEGEAPRLPGVAIGGEEDLTDLTDRGEQLLELGLWRIKCEVSDK